MTAWFVQQGDDSDLGPLRPAELLDLVRNGTVVATSMLRKDDSAWFAAGSVGGLFEAARRPTIEHFCPNCLVRVRQPPCQCPKCMKDLVKTKVRITEHSIKDRPPDQDATATGPSASAKNWFMKRFKKDRD